MKNKFVRGVRLTFLFAACISLFACQSFDSTDNGMSLNRVEFTDLPRWNQERHLQGVRAFALSCQKILKQRPSQLLLPQVTSKAVGDLQGICNNIIDINNEENARMFFEEHFDAYVVQFDGDRRAFFTGYYEPIMQASRTRQFGFEVPLRAVPNDIVTVNLADFDNVPSRDKIYGRIDEGQLKPYWSRSEIEGGALSLAEAKPIAWVATQVDKFFLQIQGSGLLALTDGSQMRVGFAGRNGRPYTAIGRPLIDRGELERETISMQSIRQWLASHPDKANGVMNLNESYIFFRELAQSAPVGAQGVTLTPEHSLAVDPKFWRYGLPLYMTADHPENANTLARLVIAQDTGSAIKGALRGDFYWGGGANAAQMAGTMKADGALWVLLPK